MAAVPMANVTGPPALDAPGEFRRSLVRIRSVAHSVSGSADQSVNVRDVATAASIDARLIRDLLG